MRQLAKRPRASSGAIRSPASSLHALRASMTTCTAAGLKRKRRLPTSTRFASSATNAAPGYVSFRGAGHRPGRHEIHLRRRDCFRLAVAAAASHATAVHGWAGEGVSNETHSRMMDMMDAVTAHARSIVKRGSSNTRLIAWGRRSATGMPRTCSGCARQRNFEEPPPQFHEPARSAADAAHPADQPSSLRQRRRNT